MLNELGATVRKLRHERELSQERLARVVDVSFRTIYRIEAGEQWMSSDVIQRLAAALGVQVRDLFPVEKPVPVDGAKPSRSRFPKTKPGAARRKKASGESGSIRPLTYSGSDQAQCTREAREESLHGTFRPHSVRRRKTA